MKRIVIWLSVSVILLSAGIVISWAIGRDMTNAGRLYVIVSTLLIMALLVGLWLVERK